MQGPAAQAERQLVLYDRPFQMNLVGKGADSHAAVEFLEVAVVGAHVND